MRKTRRTSSGGVAELGQTLSLGEHPGGTLGLPCWEDRRSKAEVTTTDVLLDSHWERAPSRSRHGWAAPVNPVCPGQVLYMIIPTWVLPPGIQTHLSTPPPPRFLCPLGPFRTCVKDSSQPCFLHRALSTRGRFLGRRRRRVDWVGGS